MGQAIKREDIATRWRVRRRCARRAAALVFITRRFDSYDIHILLNGVCSGFPMTFDSILREPLQDRVMRSRHGIYAWSRA